MNPKFRPPHRKFVASVVLSSGLASIALLGGLGIQAVRSELLAFVPLIIALPAMNAIAGDYATLIASHIGDPEIYQERVKKLVKSLLISVPVSIAGITAMSLFVAYTQGFAVSRPEIIEYVTLVSISLLAVLLITLLSIMVINYVLKNRQINSDDILIPLSNTIASVLILISFAVISLRI